MKIREEHFNEIKNALSEARDHIAMCATQYQDAGLSAQRYMWDSFRFAKVNGNTTRWMCDELYQYLDDSHINTALKTAFSELGLLHKEGSEVSWTAKEDLDSSSKSNHDQSAEPEETMGSRFAG